MVRLYPRLLDSFHSPRGTLSATSYMYIRRISTPTHPAIYRGQRFGRLCQFVPRATIYSPSRERWNQLHPSTRRSLEVCTCIINCYNLHAQPRAVLSKCITHNQTSGHSGHSALPLILRVRISSAIILLLLRQANIAASNTENTRRAEHRFNYTRH